MRELLNLGATAYARQRANKTAAHLAIETQNIESLKILLKNCPDLIYSQTAFGDTLAHYAVQVGSAPILKVLIDEYRADVTKYNKNGYTPFHDALALKHFDCAASLINHCPSLFEMPTGKGVDILHFAILEELPLDVDQRASSIRSVSKTFTEAYIKVMDALKRQRVFSEDTLSEDYERLNIDIPQEESSASSNPVPSTVAASADVVDESVSLTSVASTAVISASSQGALSVKPSVTSYVESVVTPLGRSQFFPTSTEKRTVAGPKKTTSPQQDSSFYLDGSMLAEHNKF